MSAPLRVRPDAPLGTLIFRAGLLPADTIESALEEGVRTGKRLGEILIERGLISEVDLGRLLAGQKGLEFVNLREQVVDPAAAALFTEEQARSFPALPFAFDDEVPVVAIVDPADEALLGRIADVCGREDTRFVVTTPDQLASVVDIVYSLPLAHSATTPDRPAHGSANGTVSDEVASEAHDSDSASSEEPRLAFEPEELASQEEESSWKADPVSPSEAETAPEPFADREPPAAVDRVPEAEIEPPAEPETEPQGVGEASERGVEETPPSLRVPAPEEPEDPTEGRSKWFGWVQRDRRARTESEEPRAGEPDVATPPAYTASGSDRDFSELAPAEVTAFAPEPAGDVEPGASEPDRPEAAEPAEPAADHSQPGTEPTATTSDAFAPDIVAPDSFAPEADEPAEPAPGHSEPDAEAAALTANWYAPAGFEPESPAPDSFAPDTAEPTEPAPDRSEPDTEPAMATPVAFAPDTFAPDIFAPDSFAPDTAEPTEPARDRSEPDALTPDAGASVAGPFEPESPEPDSFAPEADEPTDPDTEPAALTADWYAPARFEPEDAEPAGPPPEDFDRPETAEVEPPWADPAEAASESSAQGSDDDPLAPFEEPPADSEPFRLADPVEPPASPDRTPVPEPVEDPEPAPPLPAPPAAESDEEDFAPAPDEAVLAPSRTWQLTIRLANGERVEAGQFGDQDAAKHEARTIMSQVGSDRDDWPFVNGRFLKPDTIVSVDIAEDDGDDA